MSLQLNDPVSVENKSSTQRLQGVIAYLGPVSFADGDDWVGVRLTGDSVGKGKNDGSVKGKLYFNCSPNGGVFVRKSSLRKRNLTRLDELRLKREITGKGMTGSRRGFVSAKPSTPGQDDDTSVVSSVSNATTSTNRSRLEEIRQRRLALTSAGSLKSLKSPKPKKSTVTPRKHTTPTSETAKMQEKIDVISKKLRAKEEENVVLQKSLQSAEQAAHDANISKEEAESALTVAKQKFEETIATTAEKTSIRSIEQQHFENQEELSKIRADNEWLERENLSLSESLAESQSQIRTLQEEVEREKDGRVSDMETAEAELSMSRSDVSMLRKELASKTEQAAQRDEKNASQYKEQAKLQAEVSAWQRRVKEVETEKIAGETSFEELTLDKYQLQEKLETIQDNYEELKIDAESAQIELDELRIDLEEARDRAEKAEAALAVGAVGSSADKGSGTSTGVRADAEDVAQALSIQNSRLREAIVRLREQTSLEKVELFRQVRVLEKDAEIASSVVNEVDTLRTKDSKLQLELRELKEMVDQGTAFEKMVEDLSERVMVLEDNNVTLQVTIKELEEGSELNAEMEEVQNFEIKVSSFSCSILETYTHNFSPFCHYWLVLFNLFRL